MRNYALHLAQQRDLLPAMNVLTRIWNNWKTRRDFVRLSAFDDHMLRDIGVTRADVEAARNSPLSENVALHFKRIASADSWFAAHTNHDRGLLSSHTTSDHIKRDIGWLDGHKAPGSSH
jgi:uncharacterized protein YjiS (DUF1127 family)